jgi:hypothetical protein
MTLTIPRFGIVTMVRLPELTVAIRAHRAIQMDLSSGLDFPDLLHDPALEIDPKSCQLRKRVAV